MKEKVFLWTIISSDETKALVCQSFDFACHKKFKKNELICKI
jgi:hypothetical protein